MSDKIKLRATMTWTYMANPDNYGTDDPKEIAAIDQDQEDLEAMLSMGIEQEDFTFTVKSEVE